MHALEYNTLLCQNKALRYQLDAFTSGKRYQELAALRAKDAAHYKCEIKKLKGELAETRLRVVSVRNRWLDTLAEMQKEHECEIAKLRHENKTLQNQIYALLNERDAATDKVKEYRTRLYEIETELEEEKGRNEKLHAQLNRDFENSSIPSSKSIKPKRITNSREKSDRNPGGQKGHEGHGRVRHEPTTTMHLPAPEEVLSDPDFHKTGKVIAKQMISIRLVLEVRELTADVYYNSKTNEYRHAEFPRGYVNEVNYDGSVKGFLYLLNNDCNVSIDKSRKFLSDLTGDRLNVSKGMISSLAAAFARGSEKDLAELTKDLLVAPVLHIDNTNARVNGNSHFVFVCALPDGRALYYHRRTKGHNGVKGTVAEDYQGTLVHDHDVTFYSYGSDHQECNAHILRYLKDSIQNETSRTWNKAMHHLVQEMIHYRNSLGVDEDFNREIVAEFENRYDDILTKAREEYGYEPPGKYYKDGFNLYRRMEKYRENHLLFLHDKRVPTTNNEAERLLRNFKRKQAQAVTFRSDESVTALCEGMSMLVLIRQKDGANVFEEVSNIFQSV
jgi:hypothetical protein